MPVLYQSFFKQQRKC